MRGNSPAWRFSRVRRGESLFSLIWNEIGDWPSGKRTDHVIIPADRSCVTDSGEFHGPRLNPKSAILQQHTESRNSMKIQRLLIVLTILNLALLLTQLFQARPTLAQSVAPVLRGKGLEIV